MKRFVEGDDRSQSTLFPERLEDNPARVIEAFIEEPPRACARAAQSSQVGLRSRSAHIPTTGTAASRTLSNVAMCGP